RWWRRRRCDERHHRGRRRQHVGGHQRNDDDGRDQRGVHDDRNRNRIPLLAAYLDGRLDDIAEHVTWHGVTPPLQRATTNKIVPRASTSVSPAAQGRRL